MNRKAASSTSITGYYSREIDKLKQELVQRFREWRSLSEQNSSLRRKEELLLKSISTLGENLHFSALAAALELNRDITTEPCPREIAECLAQDLQVYSLLHSVSKPELSSVLAAESYTAQVLKDAITPERISEIRSTSQEAHMQVFRDLTMRLAFHLTRHNQQQQRSAEARSSSTNLALKNVARSSTLESAVDDYSRYIMLVSMTDYKGIQRMCYYSLESLERATPPNGYWRDVMLEMGLTPIQMEQIRDAYEHYKTKMTPLFARAQELGNKVRQLLLAVEAATSDSVPSSSSSSFSGGGGVGVPAVSQQHQQHDQDHSSQLPAQASAAAAAPCGAPAQHSQELLLHRQQQLQRQHLQLQQQGMQKLQEAAADAELQPSMDKDCPAAVASDEAPAAASGAAAAEHRSFEAANNGAAGNLHITGSGSSMQPVQQAPPVPSGSSSTGGSIKPWQEFGLASTGLGVEAADTLTALLTELEQYCNSMSQHSHGLTFPVINMLNRLQLTKMAVASFPFLPNICQISKEVYWEVIDAGAGP